MVKDLNMCKNEYGRLRMRDIRVKNLAAMRVVENAFSGSASKQTRE